MMNQTQQELVRALVAAQVAVFEWGDCDVNDEANVNIALHALDECLKEAGKLAKKLRSE